MFSILRQVSNFLFYKTVNVVCSIIVSNCIRQRLIIFSLRLRKAFTTTPFISHKSVSNVSLSSDALLWVIRLHGQPCVYYDRHCRMDQRRVAPYTQTTSLAPRAPAPPGPPGIKTPLTYVQFDQSYPIHRFCGI
jgi:hypothetical protein